MTKKKSSSRSTTKKTTKRKAEAKSSSTRGGTSRSKSSSTSKRKTPTKKKTSGSAKKSSTRGKSTSKRSTSTRKKSNAKQKSMLSVYQKTLIGGIGVILTTAILVLSLLSPNQGTLTSLLSNALWGTFGWGGLFVPLVLIGIGIYLVQWGMEQAPRLPTLRVAGAGLLFLTFEALATLFVIQRDNHVENAFNSLRNGGGFVGGLLAWVTTNLVGAVGALIVFMVIGIVGIVLASGFSRADWSELWDGLWLRDEDDYYDDAYYEEDPEVEAVRGRIRPTAPSFDPNNRGDREIPAVTALRREGLRAEEATLKPSNGRRATRAAPAAEEKPKRTSRKRKSAETKRPAADPTPIVLGQAATQGPGWKLPGVVDMLVKGSDPDLSLDSISEQAQIIEHTLESFGAPGKIVEVSQGPTVTQFGVEPQYLEARSGKRLKVKVSKIAGLADDLALALAAKSVRVQAPVPGKGYIGIEVPNVSKVMVSLRDVMESAEFQKIRSPLSIGLGQNVAGTPVAADLAKMPHLLVAGATGSGKSVCVNSIIASLLLQNTPEDLRFVMVDPKRVELTGYNGIPHLAAPVVVDMERVVGVLQWALREMDQRYQLFAKVGARNITGYNKKALKEKKDKLPYIVIIVDELADLMMTSPEDTERAIARLAQMARATGIHMILATQRPSVDVVTGLIKANFPARIAFAVASATDSRVVLDSTGAERLLGAGDMLLQLSDKPAPERMQGCFVSDEELNKLINYWRTARRFQKITTADSQPIELPAAGPNNATERAEYENRPENRRPESKMTKAPKKAAATVAKERAQRPVAPPPAAAAPAPEPKPEPAAASEPLAVIDDADAERPSLEDIIREEQERAMRPPQDELFDDVVAYVRDVQKASTSLLQRKFRIGYTRSARLIDELEDQGIIGPPTGTSKPREVLPYVGDPTAFVPEEPTTTD